MMASVRTEWHNSEMIFFVLYYISLISFFVPCLYFCTRKLKFEVCCAHMNFGNHNFLTPTLCLFFSECWKSNYCSFFRMLSTKWKETIKWLLWQSGKSLFSFVFFFLRRFNFFCFAWHVSIARSKLKQIYVVGINEGMIGFFFLSILMLYAKFNDCLC